MNPEQQQRLDQAMETFGELLQNAHAVKGQVFVNVVITLFDMNQIAMVLGRLVGAHEDPTARQLANSAVMLLGRVGAQVVRDLSVADAKEAADLAGQMADRQHALAEQITGEG